MITKQRTDGKEYFILEALKRRLSPNHPNYINVTNQLTSLQAGNWGEDAVSSKLQNFNPPFKYYVLNDVFLRSIEPFQMDHLILTPYFLLIIESKNLKNDIEITNNPDQMIQTFPDGTRKVYDSPLAQVERNIMWLKYWLQNENISVPVYGLVVFTNTNCMIKTSQVSPIICRTKDLGKKILDFPRENQLLTDQKLVSLSRLFSKEHQTFSKGDLLLFYEIEKKHILPGVECEKCAKLGMIWRKKSARWYCTCGNISKNAHENALKDFRYLRGNQLTNQECREFLQIEGRNIARRLLLHSNYVKEGDKRSSIYKFSE